MKKTLVELTPTKYRCHPIVSTCPAVFKSREGTYIIIGKTLDPSLIDDLRARVGIGETAIEISVDLIEEAISTSRA